MNKHRTINNKWKNTEVQKKKTPAIIRGSLTEFEFHIEFNDTNFVN